ncbi:MAG: hypothetical protein PHW52_04655 [Candidatus Pacebacteria bacterium]|nr:hypothetical protein [Candidatus Paceibacterota bacterium]
MENFSPIKLIIFGLVFLFFFSIPIMTITQMQKIDNENKIINDLKQIEAWGQIYRIKNDNFKGFENDIEIRMLKIDLVSTTGKDMEMYFNENFNSFCVKAQTNKNNVFCIDDSGKILKEAPSCFQGSGRCK